MQYLSRHRDSTKVKSQKEEVRCIKSIHLFYVMEYFNTDMQKTIQEVIHSERDRKIISRRLIDGITIFDLAEEFDLSPRQMQRIVTRNEHIVFKYYKGV